ncbi:hypothetical protein L202_06865 [Cryptococcus amylolentus CBS 6039]|uniref:Uncharacterized protein n=2 Tax=Cryptococcus amylolentus TaxID=104669 RepID=A0A1E3HGD8_9TREE|nr:hypothetical protein L202_06865 [Cryptococcus amylolentus CBS 6039]ODN74481.1 hypothetical protein L202_06865 [Cryptococcus amylolentus CBS 6039]ODO01470.1 hypothetical protein I350_06290 [Cryptococcus amylolentus CBS 6273]
MVRSLVDVEEELYRLWSLVGELSEQLSNNRALVTQLKARADNIQGQAVHAGTGFPLRRFNVDISAEKFQTELEAFSSHLVLENQQLQHENKQLNALLKEYEQTLETVMSKFRGVAHTSQQHDLSLHSYYTHLLQTLQTAHSSAQLHDSTSLSLLLNRLSTLLRSALRSMQGEDTGVEEQEDIGAMGKAIEEAERVLAGEGSSALGAPAPDRSSRGPSPTSQPLPSQSAKTLPRAPNRPPHFPGFLPGSSGGYAGTEGQADWALEREMEILRLEDENRQLREMLGIAEESKLPLPLEQEVVEEGKEGEEEAQRRKSSLTVEELEADAAMEAERIDAQAEMGLDIDQLQIRPDEDVRAEDAAPRRPVLVPSVLGFETDTPPPESAIVDELDGEGDGVAPLEKAESS